MSSKRMYQEKVTSFFQKYSETRRTWVDTLESWKDARRRTADREKIERLMAQIEDNHNAIQAILAHESPDFSRVKRLYKDAKHCYKEARQLIKPVIRQWIEALIFVGIAAFFLRTYVFGFYNVPTGSAEPNVLVGDRIFGNKMAYLFHKPKHGDLVIFDNAEFVYDKGSALQRWWQKYIGFSIPLLGLKGGPDNWVKRVIGVPGDTIEGRMENGKTVVYRNGERLDESYISPFPLMMQHKISGLFYADSLFGMITPPFFWAYKKQVSYVYDPSKPLDEQPFYATEEQEIMRNSSGEPVLLQPRDPSYDARGKNVDVFGPFTIPEGKYWVQGDSRRNSRDSRYWGFLDQSLIQGRAAFVAFSLDSEEPLFLFSLLKHPIAFFTKYMRWGRTFMGLYKVPNWNLKTNTEDKNE